MNKMHLIQNQRSYIKGMSLTENTWNRNMSKISKNLGYWMCWCKTNMKKNGYGVNVKGTANSNILHLNLGMLNNYIGHWFLNLEYVYIHSTAGNASIIPSAKLLLNLILLQVENFMQLLCFLITVLSLDAGI